MRHILEELQTLISSAVVGESVNIGSLPIKGGISIAIVTGNPLATYRQRQSLNRIVVSVNSKYADQDKALQVLCDIHKALRSKIGFGSTVNWQITNIDTSTSPMYLGQEDNEYYLYGSNIEVTYYEKTKATDYPTN